MPALTATVATTPTEIVTVKSAENSMTLKNKVLCMHGIEWLDEIKWKNSS